MNVESVIGRLRRKYFASAAPRRRGAPNRLKVESLEAREVPATLPAPVIDYTTTRNIDVATNIQDFAPTIAQDPLNPNNLFGAMVEKSGASSTMTMIYSNNGGVTWVSSARYANGFDPEASTPGGLVRFTNVSNPSVTFDRFDNAYLTYTEHTLNNSSGRLVLRKYNFAGTPLELDIGDKNPADNANNAGTTNGTPGHTLYQWLGTDPAYNPTVAVDFNEAVTLPDPDTGESQTDQIAATQPTADQVKVFVAWNSDDVTPENTGANFISNIIRMTASNDGGVNFAPSVIVNNNNHFSASGTAYTQPKIVFTPGRDGQGTSGGQMVTLFSNADATGSSGPNSPGLISDVSTFDTTTAPISFEAINSQGVGIPSGGADATSPTGFQFVDYPITVPAGSGISTLEELSVRLAIQQDSSLSEMQIDLISPDGTRRVRLLKFYDPSNPPAGGIAGGSLLGLSDINGGDRVFAAGTVFTDNAAREIQDRTAASPFIGEFRPDTGTLSGPTGTFTGMTPAEFEGQWIVRISDNTGTTFSFGSRIQEAALRLSQNFRDNLGPDTQTGIFGITPNSPTGTNHPNAGTAAAAASPAGFGTGLSLAVDNTQGSFSPYQNRVYAAYEKGGSVLVSFSDDNGKLWTVSPATIGPGFNPQIAVDPATGTVLVSYYSANDDPALTLNGTLPGTRSVTMLATSVNGPAFTSNGSTPQGRIEFSKPAPVNPQDTTYDQIRSKTIKTEYVSSNGPGMGAETYGNNMGLVSYSGNVSLLYGGNLDRAFSQVRTQRLHIAAGPRIAGADTGAILTESTLADKFAGGTITYNGPAATGQAQFTGFYVEFDRVISQVSPKVFAGVAAPSPFDTFNPEDIKIIYRAPGSDPTGNGVQITPLFVQRIDDFVDPVPTGGGHVAQDYGSKRFFVAVAPRDQAGTYSYVVGPMAGYEGGRFGNTDSNANPILGSNVIRDRIRNTTFALGTPTGTVLYNSTDDAPPPPLRDRADAADDR